MLHPVVDCLRFLGMSSIASAIGVLLWLQVQVMDETSAASHLLQSCESGDIAFVTGEAQPILRPLSLICAALSLASSRWVRGYTHAVSLAVRRNVSCNPSLQGCLPIVGAMARGRATRKAGPARPSPAGCAQAEAYAGEHHAGIAQARPGTGVIVVSDHELRNPSGAVSRRAPS